MAYSVDFRKRVLAYYYNECHTLAEVYAAFKVRPATLRDWVALRIAGLLSPVG
jgi:transposase-like protein